MKNCEEYQMNISAMLDGELGGEDLRSMIQHVAQCPECLAVLGVFQSLQDKVDAEAAPPPVPRDTWRKISEKMASKPRAASIPLRPRVFKVLGIAAAFALVFGMGYFLRSPVIPGIDRDAPIVLAGDRGHMSEAQFLSLTRSLLSADPEYHRRMYLILHALNSDYMRAGIETLDEDDLSPSAQIVTANSEDGGNVDVYKF